MHRAEVLRPAISPVPVALMATGCTRSVEIPREQVATKEFREPGYYRIRLHGWNEYNARRFSVTDSTVVLGLLIADPPAEGGF
jgi:hypothetical protein